MKSRNKYYVVWKGLKPGIYSSWTECEKQIKGFKDAQYKKFDSLVDANNAYSGAKTIKSNILSVNNSIDYNSISVDAACSGNPGIMEYQGVDTKTREVIFHQGPYKEGTNNIGEFLAIVHALAWIKKDNIKLKIIYTDSLTALSWIRNKRCNTKVEFNRDNEILKNLIQRAEAWLHSNNYTTEIRKWDTKSWGEIPADFGRK
jgi:ribonuclease HI